MNTEGGSEASNEIKPPPIPTFQPQPQSNQNNQPNAADGSKPNQPMPMSASGSNLYSIKSDSFFSFYFLLFHFFKKTNKIKIGSKNQKLK